MVIVIDVVIVTTFVEKIKVMVHYGDCHCHGQSFEISISSIGMVGSTVDSIIIRNGGISR